MNFLKNIFWNDTEKRLRALFRIVLLLLLAGIFANIIALVFDDISDLLDKSILNFFIMLAILLSIFLVGKYIDKRDWSEFGITVLPFKQFVYGSLFGAFLVAIIFTVQYLLGWLSLSEIRFNQFSSHAFIIVFSGQVFRYLCGSMFEEAFSRGYLLLNITEGLKGKITASQSLAISYVITSSIFGLLHLFNDNASCISSINLILLGFLFGWMVIKTGKLHFSIGLHAFWNIFQNNVFGFANSGKKSIASMYTFENSGSILWTGGEFGIEGGLICTITIIFGILLLSYSEITGIKRFNQQVLR